MEFRYGMRLRGYSPGCQPMDGLLRREDSEKYYDELVYDRPLTGREMKSYELERLFTYGEFKEQEQAEFNALPIFFAFSDKQFKEQMEKRGLTWNDTDKVVRLSDLGGFYLKEDAEKIHAWIDRPNYLKQLMNDPAFAEEAFYYEMGNHEYHINWQGDYDLAMCFGKADYKEGAGIGYYLREMGYGDDTLKAARRAAQRFFKDAEEKGWY